MAVSNLSNVSNVSNISNVSNVSFDTGASSGGARELDSLGQGSSLPLSIALRSAMLAFDGVPVPIGALPAIPAGADYRRMNARHRMHILLTALLADVVVDRAGPAPGAVACLSVGGVARLQLSADMAAASLDWWRDQAAQLEAQKWHRDERLGEIVLQQTDILSFLAQAVAIGPQTHGWVHLLLGATIEVAFRLAAEIKHILLVPRPFVIMPEIAPVLQTPAHSSFPSGHATEAFACAGVLGALYPDRAANLRRMAARIADNRGYAGLHFPIDHHAGAVLGDHIAHLVVERVFGAALLGPAAAAAMPQVMHAGALPPAPVNVPGADVEDYALSGGILTSGSTPLTVAEADAAAAAPVLRWLAQAVLTDRDGRA